MFRFESPVLEGPVPTLFSSNPGEAKRSLTASPQLAYECLQALLSRLLARKEITIEEAEEYIQRPVPRAERRPFEMDWSVASSRLPTPSTEPSPGPSSLKDKGTYNKDDFCSGQYSVIDIRSIFPKVELNNYTLLFLLLPRWFYTTNITIYLVPYIIMYFYARIFQNVVFAELVSVINFPRYIRYLFVPLTPSHLA